MWGCQYNNGTLVILSDTKEHTFGVHLIHKYKCADRGSVCVQFLPVNSHLFLMHRLYSKMIRLAIKG